MEEGSWILCNFPSVVLLLIGKTGLKGAISALNVDSTLCVPKVYTDCTLVLPGCTLLVCFKVIAWPYFFPAYWYIGIQCLAFKLLFK